MNGIGLQDKDEIWWFESIGGHHWIAKRVPDDRYVVVPNQLGIDYLDLVDAFGEQASCMCSADLLEFITENHLDLVRHEDGYCLKNERAFDVRAAFGSHDDSDHTYNTCRAWFMEHSQTFYTLTSRTNIRKNNRYIIFFPNTSGY